jgi:hypothetical protein
MIHRFALISLIVFAATIARGQEVIEALPRWMASAHLAYYMPQQPVSRILDHNHIGFHVEAQYRVLYNKPFLAGAYFDEYVLSRHVIKYEYSSGNGPIDVKEIANTRRISGGITAGFYPEINWLLQPYVQGRFGLAVFQTSSILHDRDTGEEIERISEYNSATPSYGIDLGMHIVPNIWYIRGDVRVGYDANTSTSYMLLDEENAGDTGYPIDYFDLHTSAGHWLKFSVGLSYLF